MKKILFLLVGGLWAAVAGAQQSGPFMQKTFPRATVKQLASETSGGNISVYGSTSGDARVEVYVWANGRELRSMSNEEIQKRLTERFDITVGMEGSTLQAIAKHKREVRWGNNELSISFKIYVPQNVSTSLRTSGGNINLKDLSGTQDFRTSGGNLDIDQLSGRVTGRTSGGNVTVTDSKDDIDLHTSGGNMEATHCEGNLKLETSGGNVTLRMLKGTIHANTSGGEVHGEEISGELQTRTSGGNIRLRDLSCSIAASTSGGNVDVSVRTPGKYIDLSNSSGDISLQLPQGQGMDLRIRGERVHSSGMSNFKGDVDDRHIDGALNGGGIPVKVDGNSGSVHVNIK